MSLTSHPYKTRSQTFDGSGNTSGTTVSVATSENITNLETKLLSRFDELTKELLNLKDVIIKNLQAGNERLREKVFSLDSKVTSLEINQNKLEQYGRRNNIKVSGIPDSFKDNCLKEKNISVFTSVGIDVKSYDIEACHRIGKSRNSSKKAIVRFSNRKFAKQALSNRKKLKSIDKSTLGFTNDLFINENLTPVNNRIVYNCKKLKRQNLISKTYTVNGMVYLISNNVKRGKPVKVLHMQTLLNLFPEAEFEASSNEEEDVNELADECYQSSY